MGSQRLGDVFPGPGRARGEHWGDWDSRGHTWVLTSCVAVRRVRGKCVERVEDTRDSFVSHRSLENVLEELHRVHWREECPVALAPCPLLKTQAAGSPYPAPLLGVAGVRWTLCCKKHLLCLPVRG